MLFWCSHCVKTLWKWRKCGAVYLRSAGGPSMRAGKSATIKETDMWSFINCTNGFVKQESGITLIHPILWGPSSFLSLRLCLFKVMDDILCCSVMDEVPSKSSKPLSMSLPRTLTQQQLPYYKMKLSPQVLSQTTHTLSLSPLHYSCMTSDDSLKIYVCVCFCRDP